MTTSLILAFTLAIAGVTLVAVESVQQRDRRGVAVAALLAFCVGAVAWALWLAS